MRRCVARPVPPVTHKGARRELASPFNEVGFKLNLRDICFPKNHCNDPLIPRQKI